MLAFFLVCNMINYSFFLYLFLPHGVLSACGSYRAVSFLLSGCYVCSLLQALEVEAATQPQ